jgi:hypothetical protein
MLVIYGMPIDLKGVSPLIARNGYPGTAALYCVLGLATIARDLTTVSPASGDNARM